jgi:hypothetical protein
MLAAVAAAAGSNPKRKLRIKERRSLVRRRKATTMLRLGKLLNDASETPAYSQSGRTGDRPSLSWSD